jgi:uncharacterized protein (TIGR02118 family)
MIKRMTLLAKRQDLTKEQFSDYWLNNHGQILKRMPTVGGYVQNLITEDIIAENQFSFDGVVELWFADLNAQTTAFATDAAKELPFDEPNFIRGITIYAVNEHKMSAVPQLHKVLLVARSAAVANETLEISGPIQAMCASLPRANLVTVNKLGRAGWRETLWHEPAPPDVIMELGFDNAADVNAFCNSREFADLRASVVTGGGAVGCYRVEPRRII